MSSGGARYKSGPARDPHSGRTERAGITYTRLPAEGYTGKAPKFPLPEPTAREHQVWRELWTTPQAAAWAKEKWRHRDVAMYVRYTVRMEEPDAPASLAPTALRLRDDIGLSVAGMKANGWVLSTDQLAPRREDDAANVSASGQDRSTPPVKSARNRLRAVGDGGA